LINRLLLEHSWMAPMSDLRRDRDRRLSPLLD